MAQAELFSRMSSASSANSARWATEIAWVASRGFSGVRLGIGISDANGTGIAYNAAVINLDNLTTILDMLIMAGLKCQLQIGGEGPPNNPSWYSTLAGFGSAWPYSKRPPVGNSNTVVADRTAEIKTAAIALMVNKYRASGQNPSECCSVELWNELARGGAGAPAEYPASDYWSSGVVLAKGTWDSPIANDPAPTSTPYSTIVEYLNVELPQIDFQNLSLISPSFASLMLDQVTNGLTRELETCLDDGAAWLEVFFASPKPSWGINCYYSLENAEISMGSALFAHRAVYGRDNRVASSSDVNAITRRFDDMRASLPMTNGVGFTICEAGVSPVHVGMTAATDRTRRLNYEELGRHRLAYLDALRMLDVQRVIFYTASDTESTDLEDQFGTFNDEIGTANDQTYSADVPFARRAGLSGQVPFAGDNYVLATGEVLPPGLP